MPFKVVKSKTCYKIEKAAAPFTKYKRKYKTKKAAKNVIKNWEAYLKRKSKK